MVSRKMDLSFLEKKISKSLSIFFFKKLRFLGGKTWAIRKPYHPANGPSKNIWGLLFKNLNIQSTCQKVIFSLLWNGAKMQFYSKMKSCITHRLLNQSGWDLIWVNIYFRSINTPNLILIGCVTVEFWGLERLTRQERPFKSGQKNERFEVCRQQFLS